MRRITWWSLSTLTALVLLFSYHTSTSSRAPTMASPVLGQANAPSQTTTPSDAPTSGSSSGASAGSSGSSSSTAARTYDGAAVNTRYGNVQVQITVANGKITAARVLQVPWSDHRDQQISSAAVPILNQESVASQNANIDMVSGATYTSDGYMQSLQSAIDQAHL